MDRLQLRLLEASIDMGVGRTKEAKRGLKELVTAAEKGGVRYFVAQAMVVEAELANRQGDAAEVREVLRRIRRDGLWKVLGRENRVRLSEIERSLDRTPIGKSGPRAPESLDEQEGSEGRTEMATSGPGERCRETLEDRPPTLIAGRTLGHR